MLPYRNHISYKKIPKILKLSTSNTFIKPNGFWYGIRDEWYNFLLKEMMIKPKYIYQVVLYPQSFTTINHPNVNKILQIKSIHDWYLFDEKYHSNWNLVKQDFGGIEIPNLKKLRQQDKTHSLVLDAWDVSSGCIWNIDIIKRINFID